MKCHVCRQGNLIRQQIGWECDRCKVTTLSAFPRYRIYLMPSATASVIETPDGEWVQWQDIQEEMTALRSAAEKLQALVAELTNELCITRSAVECPPLTPYSDTGGTEANAETVKGFASVIAQQAARVAELEDALLEIDKWQTGENNIEDDEDWEADEVLRRRVRAIVKQALAGRKEPT
jgi:hypothetical protein